MTTILQKTHPLTASDIDCHRLIRPSALLGYLQNMATEHAEILGIGGGFMVEHHSAFWMMARLYLSLNHPISFDDKELTIRTWHRGVTKSPIIYRDFDLFLNGSPVGEAVMSWVLANIQDRKIIKPASIPILKDSPKPEQLKDITPAKIKMPETLTQAMTRQIYYSDTDINGHMNNTKYADIACDAIQYHKRQGQFISELQINYLRECFPGEELRILRTQNENTYYVQGSDSANQHRFEVSLRLSAM